MIQGCELPTHSQQPEGAQQDMPSLPGPSHTATALVPHLRHGAPCPGNLQKLGGSPSVCCSRPRGGGCASVLVIRNRKLKFKAGLASPAACHAIHRTRDACTGLLGLLA